MAVPPVTWSTNWRTAPESEAVRDTFESQAAVFSYRNVSPLDWVIALPVTS